MANVLQITSSKRINPIKKFSVVSHALDLELSFNHTTENIENIQKKQTRNAF